MPWYTASCFREISPLQLSELPAQDRRAVAGLSGGVDSTVAALLTRRSGFDVLGIILLTPGAKPQLAAAACRGLGIEHQAVEAEERFERCVMREFVADWARGLTPNPCVVCNPRVKFDLLAREADARDRPVIVTGHYARVQRSEDHRHLLRGLDSSRDQSYMLYRLPQSILRRLALPLGEIRKDQVRQIASEEGLAVADRSDSQDVCFAPGGDLAEIIGRHRPEALEPGPIVDTDGREVGSHRGLAHYTVGQRRGLGIGGPEGPYFVLKIDPANNALVVGDEEQLWVETTEVEQVHLIGAYPGETFDASVMTRYRGTETQATVRLSGDRAVVHFRRPHRAPAPGQSAVFYQDQRCLGGGIIVQPEA